MQTIRGAVDRSRSHDQIVHVEVEDVQQALAELRAIAAEDGLEFDSAASNTEHETWAYRVDAPEGEMVWRVHVADALCTGCYRQPCICLPDDADCDPD